MDDLEYELQRVMFAHVADVDSVLSGPRIRELAGRRARRDRLYQPLAAAAVVLAIAATPLAIAHPSGRPRQPNRAPAVGTAPILGPGPISENPKPRPASSPTPVPTCHPTAPTPSPTGPWGADPSVANPSGANPSGANLAGSPGDFGLSMAQLGRTGPPSDFGSPTTNCNISELCCVEGVSPSAPTRSPTPGAS
jgi:hypothetical protein